MATRTFQTSFETQSVVAHEVTGLRLEEALGRPTRVVVEMRVLDGVDLDQMLGEPGLLQLARGGDPVRAVAGVVDEVTLLPSTVEAGRSIQNVVVRMSSLVARLGQVFGSTIYQELDVQEIIAKVLESCGVEADRASFRLTQQYAVREYCVQYQESALAFVSRLCEEEGIYYFFETNEDGQDVVVFADESTQAPPIAGDDELPYRGKIGLEMEQDGIVSIEERHAVRSGSFVLRDYDFKRPKLDMTVEAEADLDTDLEMYDYPGLYFEPSVGEHLARVRLEAEQVERHLVLIEADCPRLTPGLAMKVAGAPRAEMDGEYFISAVVLEMKDHVVRTRATLVPKAVPFRTAQSTPRPVIHGPQTARVVCPAGAEPEEIHTDEHGRCKVKFHWDLAEADDDKASCWMRVSQLQTSGSMILPRLDWEVVVEFLEGNPDRPLVIGRLYNGVFMPPYALPEGRTRTSLRTASTPGSGGSNEIRFEDKAGGEEIMIRAQYDQNIVVANDKTKTVLNCETREVKVDETVTIGGNQTIKITKGHKVTIGADQSVSIGGNRKVEVNAVSALTAGGSSTTEVGGNHFEMDGNPLQALLALAAQKAAELATAKAGEVMAQIDGAVQSRIDQVMAPVNALQAHAQTLQAGMEAVRGGDLGGTAGLLAGAAGIPLPGPFAGLGGPAAAQSPGGGSSTAGVTAQLGVDQAVNNAIQQGIQGGANALGAALGLDSAGAGGESRANEAGPEGSVDGIDDEDRTKGPGHSLNKVGGDHSETVGAVRLVAALNGVMTSVGGSTTESVGAVKATMALGNIASSVEGAKTETSMGTLVISRADESEAVSGPKTCMVGGAIAEKIGGGHSVEATAPATFIGAFHKVEAQGKITFKCGASEVVVEGGGISITSPMVMLTAGKIQLTKPTNEL